MKTEEELFKQEIEKNKKLAEFNRAIARAIWGDLK